MAGGAVLETGFLRAKSPSPNPVSKVAAAAVGRGVWATGSERALRGGAWNNNDQNTRAAYRNNNNPRNRNNNVGFRVVEPLSQGNRKCGRFME